MFSKRRDQYCASLYVFIWCNQELDCSSLLLGERVVGQMISSGSPLFIVIKLSHVSDRTLLAFFSCCFILYIDMFFSCFSPLVSLLTVYSRLSYADTLMLQKTQLIPRDPRSRRISGKCLGLYMMEISHVLRFIHRQTFLQIPRWLIFKLFLNVDTFSLCQHSLSVYQGGWM